MLKMENLVRSSSCLLIGKLKILAYFSFANSLELLRILASILKSF